MRTEELRASRFQGHKVSCKHRKLNPNLVVVAARLFRGAFSDLRRPTNDISSRAADGPFVLKAATRNKRINQLLDLLAFFAFWTNVLWHQPNWLPLEDACWILMVCNCIFCVVTVTLLNISPRRPSIPFGSPCRPLLQRNP